MAIQIPINLASEPFRRDRQVLVASAALAVLLIVLLGWQLTTINSKRHQSADIQVRINRLSGQLRTISGEQTQLNATLRKPENAEVLERSVFLNTLIDRKGISWTRIFADLEKVMPPTVRLVSVRLPEIDSQNEVQLDMLVGAKEVLPLIELVRRLESSPQFGPTNVQTSQPPSQTDPLYRYHVTVSYAQKL
jgi:hypothetical protein